MLDYIGSKSQYLIAFQIQFQSFKTKLHFQLLTIQNISFELLSFGKYCMQSSRRFQHFHIPGKAEYTTNTKISPADELTSGDTSSKAHSCKISVYLNLRKSKAPHVVLFILILRNHNCINLVLILKCLLYYEKYSLNTLRFVYIENRR